MLQKYFVRGLCKLHVCRSISHRVYPIVVYLIGKGAIEVWSIPPMSIMKVARRSSVHVHGTVAQAAANCPHNESALFIE